MRRAVLIDEADNPKSDCEGEAKESRGATATKALRAHSRRWAGRFELLRKMSPRLEESSAWISIHGEEIDVNDTIAAKLVGAAGTRAMSRILETNPALLIFLRLMFYLTITLLLPWLARAVPEALFFAILPLGTIYPIQLYLTAPLTTLRALLTSFEVLYVLLLGSVGIIALCDLLDWIVGRSIVLLVVVLPLGVGLAVLYDAFTPQAERLAGPHATKVASGFGVVLFTAIPFFLFFDIIPDVKVKEYALGQLNGREVTVSNFSVMASSMGTISAFFLRWMSNSFKYPESYIALKAPMKKQSPFLSH